MLGSRVFNFQGCLKLASRAFKLVSRVNQEYLKLVSTVLKGSFMGVSIVFVFIEVIAATRAYGGLVYFKIF